MQGSSLAGPTRRRRRHELTLARVTDVALALLLIVATLPVMLGIALAVKLQDGGPVLFGHMRIGYGGRFFRCWKFRSMVVDADVRLSTLLALDQAARVEWDADHKLRRDPRVTPLGRRLRVTSLDELPQLFNVITGEMSLVGPRPIVAAEAARYGRWFSRYCAVKPGLTGLWQISGRNDVDYRTRVALDVLYARRSSFALYFWILAATIPAVLMRRGSY
jgi:lipopolysaccharide/colanic/teichoic acid biosynthesis glycosyltransferase